ncbi:helix-turn-helix domain-containing protein [Pseudanabaena sp. PCC 6802]|uniref:helix-turn-helix domain-containing protein n=1 Tax=Pseudanabaena sp. PCC 6802 TaxID=118173 RepID=UPI0003777CDA|nr:helix-turn-helix domain-containing protein [Pseudanabaena sp. PCC 6802]
MVATQEIQLVSRGTQLISSSCEYSGNHLVRELRFRLGLTQEQFAAELGVTFASINRWENRKVQPSPMALKLLRQRLEQMGDRGTDLLDRYF